MGLKIIFPFNFLIAAALIGCAATEEEQSIYLPSSDSNSTASGDAYTADSMHFSKPIPSRPDWKPMEFYYKHCSQVDARAYYSKTSYNCSGPY